MRISKADMQEARDFLARYLYPAEGEQVARDDWKCPECRNRAILDQEEADALNGKPGIVTMGAHKAHWDEENECPGSYHPAMNDSYTRAQVDKKGRQIYTKVTHVAKSGMSRSIECFVIEENEPINITWAVARILGERVDQKNGGVRVSGCGMDMGFHIVNYLSYSLHGHYNVHPLAGYTLEHRWL